MFKKSLVIISSVLIVAGLFACGNNAEVEELKRQVAELKQQNEQKEEVTRSIDISKSENIIDKDNTEDSTEKSISMNNIANDEEKDSNQNLTNEELKLLGEYFDIEDTNVPSYDKISLEYYKKENKEFELSKAYYIIGYKYQLKGEEANVEDGIKYYKQAIKYYDKSIELGNNEANLFKGIVCSEYLKDFGSAIECFENAYTSDDGKTSLSVESRFRLAQIFEYGQQNYEKALLLYKEIEDLPNGLELDKNYYILSLYEMAKMYENWNNDVIEKDDANALKYYETSLKLIGDGWFWPDKKHEIEDGINRLKK